jgi:hypothetical protein
MDNLVKTSPVAALKLLGVEAAPKPPVTYQSGVNTEALGFRPQPPVERKSVMHGADTSQILGAWRAARPSDT